MKQEQVPPPDSAQVVWDTPSGDSRGSMPLGNGDLGANVWVEPSGDLVLLRPAWPAEWDVRFKLHAPRRTTVECEVRDGRVVALVVTPASRRDDVTICAPFVTPDGGG